MVRIKHRYLLLNILYPHSDHQPHKNQASARQPLPDIVQFHQPSSDNLTPQSLTRAIRDQVILLYGDYGAGVTSNGLNVKYLSPATSTAIVRCSRDHYRLVWAALTYMTHLPKASKNAQPRPCVMQVVKVSGTIKKSEEEAIRRARAAILKAKTHAVDSATDGLTAILGGPDAGTALPDHNAAGTLAGVEDDEDDEMGSGSDEYD